MVLGKDERFCPVCGNPTEGQSDPVHARDSPVPMRIPPHGIRPSSQPDEQSRSGSQPVWNVKPLDANPSETIQAAGGNVQHSVGHQPKVGRKVTSKDKITKVQPVNNSSSARRKTGKDNIEERDSVWGTVEVPSIGGSLKLVIMTQTVITAILVLITSIGLIFTSILFLFSLGERGRYYGLLLLIIFIVTTISTVITVFNYSLLRGLKHRDPATRVLAVFYYILLSTPAIWGYYLFVLFLIPVVLLSFDKRLADEFSNDGGPVRPCNFHDRSRMRKPFI